MGILLGELEIRQLEILMSAFTLFFSLLGGVLPALLWLWFWLREDRLHPEPRGLLVFSFIAGMVAVLPALWLEQWVCGQVIVNSLSECPTGLTFARDVWFVIIGWAMIEEVLKYGASYYSALRKRDNDEPIDALIYLITAALGFAALENTLFLSGAIKTGGLFKGVDIGVLRFVGASLLHVVTSGFIGFCIALAFYKSRAAKRLFRALGITGAIALHTLFNFYILESAGDAKMTFTVFAFVWLAIILLIIAFEKVKQLKEPTRRL